MSLLMVALQRLSNCAPFMQTVFQTRALNLISWAVIVTWASALFFWIEL